MLLDTLLLAIALATLLALLAVGRLADHVLAATAAATSAAPPFTVTHAASWVHTPSTNLLLTVLWSSLVCPLLPTLQAAANDALAAAAARVPLLGRLGLPYLSALDLGSQPVQLVAVRLRAQHTSEVNGHRGAVLAAAAGGLATGGGASWTLLSRLLAEAEAVGSKHQQRQPLRSGSAQSPPVAQPGDTAVSFDAHVRWEHESSAPGAPLLRLGLTGLTSELVSLSHVSIDAIVRVTSELPHAPGVRLILLAPPTVSCRLTALGVPMLSPAVPGMTAALSWLLHAALTSRFTASSGGYFEIPTGWGQELDETLRQRIAASVPHPEGAGEGGGERGAAGGAEAGGESWGEGEAERTAHQTTGETTQDAQLQEADGQPPQPHKSASVPPAAVSNGVVPLPPSPPSPHDAQRSAARRRAQAVVLAEMGSFVALAALWSRGTNASRRGGSGVPLPPLSFGTQLKRR